MSTLIITDQGPIVKRSRPGRPRKYFTEDEALEAKRAKARECSSRKMLMMKKLREQYSKEQKYILRFLTNNVIDESIAVPIKNILDNYLAAMDASSTPQSGFEQVNIPTEVPEQSESSH